MPNNAGQDLSLVEIVAARRSQPEVTLVAPTHDELLPLVAAAARVADHGSMRPWRLIELRGEAREHLGAAISKATGDSKPSTKPLRASLLIAIVASITKDHKVHDWEQEAVASGVAHTLSLLLESEGWGVMWRTGEYTRSKPVRKVHKLAKNEVLLGWLYVGGVHPRKAKGSVKRSIDPEDFLSEL
jgi:nitroreductase